jgi:membrane protease YdiL (CAAX protease family)
MLRPLDHVLFATLAVLFPLRASLAGFRRLRHAPDEELPRVKLAVYRDTLVRQWGLTLVVGLLWLVLRRDWRELGLVPLATWGLGGALAGLAVVALVMLRQGLVRPEDEEALAHVRERTRHLERMLPTTLRERRWFYALALTAGVCEEVLYRGYVIWYLTGWVLRLLPQHAGPLTGPQPAFLIAAVATSLIFGAGHAYQGVRGVLLTTLVGAFLAAVYWITRSLFAGMLVHALMDLHAGYVTHLAYGRTAGPAVAPGQGPDSEALPPDAGAGAGAC